MPRDPVSLSPEAQLLLLSAALSPSDAALRDALRVGIDWEKLRALAEYEKATSVLLRQIAAVGPDVGDEGYQKLRQSATMSTIHMLQLELLLHQTTDILGREEIDVILLKGAGLGYTVFPSFADRPMGDLDVLVRPHHAERAWSLLQTHGWTSPEPHAKAERFSGHQHLPRLLREPGAFRLEIHDNVLPEEHPFRFSTDTFWARAERVAAKGRTFLVPHPTHQLWHVCVHFAWSHAMQWGGWRTLRDSAAIIQRGGFDWTDFIEFAGRTQAATCCFWTLRLARHLAGADVPDSVLVSLRPPKSEFIIERLERHFVSNLFPSEARCPSVWLTHWLWEAGISPRWSGHGTARPWQVSERWMAGSAAPESDRMDGRDITRRLRKIGAGVAYLRRLGAARYQSH